MKRLLYLYTALFLILFTACEQKQKPQPNVNQATTQRYFYCECGSITGATISYNPNSGEEYKSIIFSWNQLQNSGSNIYSFFVKDLNHQAIVVKDPLSGNSYTTPIVLQDDTWYIAEVSVDCGTEGDCLVYRVYFQVSTDSGGSPIIIVEEVIN